MYYEKNERTISAAIELLNNHTHYFVPVDDLWALEMAIEALAEKENENADS